MTVEVKTCGDHPASMAERIARRLRNSGDEENADVVKQVGHSPTRTFTNLHHSRVAAHGGRDEEKREGMPGYYNKIKPRAREEEDEHDGD